MCQELCGHFDIISIFTISMESRSYNLHFTDEVTEVAKKYLVQAHKTEALSGAKVQIKDFLAS